MRIFLITLLSLIGIFVIYVIYVVSIQVTNLEYSQNRVFSKELSLKKYSTYKFDYELSLMRNYEGKLFFVSWSKENYNKIFYCNIESISEIKSIELEFGDDEIIIGEFFLQDSFIEVFNALNSSFSKFDMNGKKISEYFFPFSVNRISKLDESNYIISGWEDNNENYPIYFKIYNSKENTIRNIIFDVPNFEKYSYMSGLILDGMYFGNENYFVNLPYSINKSLVFNEHGKFEKELDLIYKEIDFKFRNATNGEVYASPHNIDPNISGYLNSNNVFYLLSQDEYRNYFVDLYNIEENKYLNSFTIKEKENKPRYIFVSDNMLYILFTKDLIIYNIN